MNREVLLNKIKAAYNPDDSFFPTTDAPHIWALVPLKSHSQRMPGKNMRMLGKKPLYQYTFDALEDPRLSALFSKKIISSDRELALAYNWKIRGFTWVQRPSHLCLDTSPDIGWVQHALWKLKGLPDIVVILRVTSPFRTADTILAALEEFALSDCTAVRGMSWAKTTPFKMWHCCEEGQALPLSAQLTGKSSEMDSWPAQRMPAKFLEQNAMIEVLDVAQTIKQNSLHGDRVVPFVCELPEALDINDEWDWLLAEAMLASGRHLRQEV